VAGIVRPSKSCHTAPAVTTNAKSPEPADARASKFIGGNSSPPLSAGKPNTIAVVATGQYRDWLPVVVRNNTSQTMTQIKVTGTASSRSGTLLASGGDQGIYPDIVKPGEIAIGIIFFNGKRLADAVFKLEATGTPQPDSQFDNRIDLSVSKPGHTGGSVVGYLTNEAGQTVHGPVNVYVECFTQTGQLRSLYQAYTSKDSASPGKQIPFTVDLTTTYGGTDPCPVFLVAGGGFSG
jgi:hypothetical protein